MKTIMDVLGTIGDVWLVCFLSAMTRSLIQYPEETPGPIKLVLMAWRCEIRVKKEKA